MKYLLIGIIFKNLFINFEVDASFGISISTECMDLLRLHKNPLECCIYPKLEADDLLIRKCRKECPAKKRVKYNCCYRRCLFMKSEVFQNHTFSQENCHLYYTYNGIHNELHENWKEITKQSLQKCEHDVHVSNKTTEESCVPNYVHEIITCSFKENFRNCPNFSEDKTCQEMKTLVNECAKNDGRFIFYNFFFGNQMTGTTFS